MPPSPDNDIIKILIVEDEVIVAEDIAARLENMGYSIAGIADNGAQALEIASNKEIDVALVDINLKGSQDGIGLAEKLSNRNTAIIFLTALSDSDTLQRAKKLKPAAYIIKPFREKELQIAIEMAFYNLVNPSKPNDVGETQPAPLYQLEDRVFIRHHNLFEKIMIVDILYLEAKRSYCELITGTRKFVLSANLSAICNELTSPLLIRVHRSFVINLEKIDSFEGNVVNIGKTQIPIGKNYRQEFLERIKFI